MEKLRVGVVGCGRISNTYRAALKQLAEAPYQNTNVKKLVGSDFYRLRVADWRVIYDIYDDKLVITVLEMGHRKEVYR